MPVFPSKFERNGVRMSDEEIHETLVDQADDMIRRAGIIEPPERIVFNPAEEKTDAKYLFGEE